MSLATALSRVTGFVRMWAMGLAVGSGPVAAAYGFANNIPNMIFELVAGGILSSLFIPTYLKVREERGEDAAWRFASHVFNISVLSLGIVAIVGTLLPEPFIWTQTFRSDASTAALVRQPAEFFFRFFAIQVVLYGAGMVVQGLLNANRQFLWPALGPVFNNIVVIATMLAVWRMPLDSGGLAVLAMGTTLGVAAMFGVMVPSLMRLGVRYSPSLGLKDPDVRHMLVLAGPTVVYVLTNMVAVSFRNASALAAAPNGPAVLQFAWTFYQLPYGILAVALATAVFTELSQAAGREDMAAFRANFSKGLRVTALLMLPAAALLIALATPLASLFLVGRFDAADVPAVASVLRVWAAGLVFFACMMFTLRAFYSLRDTRTPMFVNLGTSAIQIGGYVVLTTGVLGWPGLGIEGVPLADGIFYVAQFVLLASVLRSRTGGWDGMAAFLTDGAKMLAVSIIAGIAAWYAAGAVPWTAGPQAALAQVVAGGVAGLAVAGLGAWAIRLPEIEFVRSRIAGGLSARITRGGRRP